MQVLALAELGADYKRRLLHWAAQHPYCLFLDSCGSEVDRYGDFAFLALVAGGEAEVVGSQALLRQALAKCTDSWLLGFLSYGWKGELEPKLVDGLAAAVEWPLMGFCAAEMVVGLRHGADALEVIGGDAMALREALGAMELPADAGITDFGGFESNFTEGEYCAAVEALRQHIRAGDCYEINLSQNLVAEVRLGSAAAVWERLVAASPVPFAGYLRWGDLHLLCASPERFLQLRGRRLLTQPIKGTAPRGASPEEDLALAEALRQSPKERAENVMIVDLSRNDLNRSCTVGSVEVPHLFEVQQFPQVHHLVSTIVGEMRAEVDGVEALAQAFPPGSMTGAPKVRSCELIAQYEQVGRGLYAGSIGYFAPGGDFDFNVVIRSLAYDSGRGILSYHVGGAITWDSAPAAEYAETLLKAKAIRGLFGERE